MSFLFILLCLVSRALGLRSSKPQSGFHPDALTTGTFSILCIFALTWGLLGIWTIVALINARCPRLPYLLVLPTLLFFAWSNAAYMVLVVLKNILSDGYPPLLIPAFTFLENIFNDWALVLQFLVIISIIRHRETTLRDATMGKLGGHRHILTGLHVTLALLTLAFGTAAEGLGLDTSVQYYNGNIPLRKYVHRLHIAQKLYYIYAAFAALTAFDVVLSAVLLWRAFKDAAIPDKIANLTLLGIAPVYSALSLLLVVFTIIFSPRGIKLSIANLDAVEGANLAASLLMPLCSIVMMILILAMTGREANWTPGNITAELEARVAVRRYTWRGQRSWVFHPAPRAGAWAWHARTAPAIHPRVLHPSISLSDDIRLGVSGWIGFRSRVVYPYS
ncbi:hypothetical protein FB45DRAFT_39647 [Roridomyces roridus]|uniref:Uncharacterized protein n=1 Tax=Roridomyces roridus TaxID=1738132 RepID=A0AAD7FJR4_9AGAR|nr:hypothetical protein FB45DRAFT_39647 [Roridomyces roridus]